MMTEADWERIADAITDTLATPVLAQPRAMDSVFDVKLALTILRGKIAVEARRARDREAAAIHRAERAYERPPARFYYRLFRADEAVSIFEIIDRATNARIGFAHGTIVAEERCAQLNSWSSP